jgi:hypothetical protein
VDLGVPGARSAVTICKYSNSHSPVTARMSWVKTQAASVNAPEGEKFAQVAHPKAPEH